MHVSDKKKNNGARDTLQHFCHRAPIGLTFSQVGASIMAILDAYPGLRTEIIVNRALLTEYNDEEAETSPTETTKYIEAR
jgi:hypothetical protein